MSAPRRGGAQAPPRRVTVNVGFHRRAPALGVTAGGVHNARATYDDARIRKRSRLIAYAIDARRPHFPGQRPYVYAPLTDTADEFRCNAAARAGLKDDKLLDLSILGCVDYA